MTYKVQIDDLVREATPEETANIDAIRQADQAQEQAAADAIKARASALIKLQALGLTPAEVAALVGQ